MRALIVSQNRVVGLGLVALGEKCGLVAATASIEQLASPQSQEDLVLLYCDQWSEDGWSAAEALRLRHVPFIVVVPAVEAELRREVLAAGALDVFHHGETAELQTVLTNFNWAIQPLEDEFTLANGGVVDLRKRRLLKDGRFFELTLTEGRLLEVLRDEAVHRPGTPVPPQAIVRQIWGATDARSDTTLRGHISKLRAKLEEDPAQPAVLFGQRGQGYYLALGRKVE